MYVYPPPLSRDDDKQVLSLNCDIYDFDKSRNKIYLVVNDYFLVEKIYNQEGTLIESKIIYSDEYKITALRGVADGVIIGTEDGRVLYLVERNKQWNKINFKNSNSEIVQIEVIDQ